MFSDFLGMKLYFFFRTFITKEMDSEPKCALECNRHDQCRSFNFCGATTCEMNREDVFSTERGEAILQDDENCCYFGMKRTSKPICHEQGTKVDIQTDEALSECQVSLKRIDAEWAPWQTSRLPKRFFSRRFRRNCTTLTVATFFSSVQCDRSTCLLICSTSST